MATVMAKATICIFGKPPRPGVTKTRLIPALGARNAALVARALLEDTVEAALQVRNAQVVISATENFLLEGRNLPLWIQPEGDLGNRVEKILQKALVKSPCVLAVGADTPGLTPAMLEDALESLDSYDAVLGPTEDGGYYLVGLTRCPEGLFLNIRWSSAVTLQDTIARLTQFGIRHTLAKEWFDLDTEEDLNRVRRLLKSSTFVAPRLASVMRSIAMMPQMVI
jgi:uncharacterized protein